MSEWIACSESGNPCPGALIDYMDDGCHVYEGIPADEIDWFDYDSGVITHWRLSLRGEG